MASMEKIRSCIICTYCKKKIADTSKKIILEEGTTRDWENIEIIGIYHKGCFKKKYLKKWQTR